jgi:hypothetical protein
MLYFPFVLVSFQGPQRATARVTSRSGSRIELVVLGAANGIKAGIGQRTWKGNITYKMLSTLTTIGLNEDGAVDWKMQCYH